jgi:peptidoglycan/LPS O-acetylase OafA/YrhL
MLDRLRPLSPLLLCGAVAVYAALFWLTDGLAATWSAPPPPRHVLHAVLEAYVGFWMTLWCLLAAKRWLAGANAIMRWLADASYWVYLVHLPILFAIQYPLLDLEAHWTAKFAISTSSTLALSFASYQLLVRHTPVGRLLAGNLPNARHRVGRPACPARPCP